MSGLDAHTVHCIACGESHMLAVIDNGSLAAWGSNEYGQLGKSRAAKNLYISVYTGTSTGEFMLF